MPGLIGKLAALAATPQGQRALRTATRKAQELAADPKNRAKVEQARTAVQQQVAKRRPAGGPAGGQPPAGGPPATT